MLSVPWLPHTWQATQGQGYAMASSFYRPVLKGEGLQEGADQLEGKGWGTSAVTGKVEAEKAGNVAQQSLST